MPGTVLGTNKTKQNKTKQNKNRNKIRLLVSKEGLMYL